MHINEYKLIQKEIDGQSISIVDYAKKHGIKLVTLYIVSFKMPKNMVSQL